ncbi:MAG TPA: MBL fold metallo-hydrolase [Candidatus Bathyarchaeia archaeon]|nr:MBL fold metallo-hydrolase [Candidatus Bathyarchaeia archaeon]
MILAQIPIGEGKNFAYIFGDEATREAAVVDPGSNVDKILRQAKQLKVHVKYIFNTHSHGDHTAGNSQMKEKTGAKIVAHVKSPRPKDVAVKDQDDLEVGKLKVKVIHTPGHTADGICLLVDGKLFTGDTLFVGECGRTDLPSSSAKDMYYSLFDKILSLDDNVEVYPGHDYGSRPISTIGDERKTNYTLEKRTLTEFIEFMKEP